MMLMGLPDMLCRKLTFGEKPLQVLEAKSMGMCPGGISLRCWGRYWEEGEQRKGGTEIKEGAAKGGGNWGEAGL